MPSFIKELRREAGILLRASLFYNLGAGIFIPFYAIYVEKIGGSLLDTGLAFAIFSIVTGVFVILFSRFNLFCHNVRLIVVLGYFFESLCYIMYIFVQHPWQLFLVQAILGFSTATDPAWDAIFGAGVTEKKAARQWAAWTGVIGITTGAGALIGGIIINYYSFTILFVLMAILNLVAGIFSFGLLKKRRHKKNRAIAYLEFIRYNLGIIRTTRAIVKSGIRSLSNVFFS